MELLKAVLYFTFVYTPLTYLNGVAIMILNNERIVGGTFQLVKIRKKTKKQIDKDKFAKMMKRITK